MNETKKKILVVDDDPDILEQTSAHLSAAGYEVKTAEGEYQATEFLENFTPDLAVIDLMMENQDSGFILSYKIKKKDPSIPVIIVTAVANQTGIPFDIIEQDESDWIKADLMMDKEIRYENLLGEMDKLLKA